MKKTRSFLVSAYYISNWKTNYQNVHGPESLIKHLLSYSRSHPKDHTWLTALQAAVGGNVGIRGMNGSVWMCCAGCNWACEMCVVVSCIRVRLSEQQRCVSLSRLAPSCFRVQQRTNHPYIMAPALTLEKPTQRMKSLNNRHNFEKIPYVWL